MDLNDVMKTSVSRNNTETENRTTLALPVQYLVICDNSTLLKLQWARREEALLIESVSSKTNTEALCSTFEAGGGPENILVSRRGF